VALVSAARLHSDVRDSVVSLCLDDLKNNQDESEYSMAVPPDLADSVEDMVLPDWKLRIEAPYDDRNCELHFVNSMSGLIDLEDTYASDSVH